MPEIQGIIDKRQAVHEIQKELNDLATSTAGYQFDPIRPRRGQRQTEIANLQGFR